MMNYDLMTGLNVYPVSFDFDLLTWRYSIHYKIQHLESFKIHSVEAASEVSQKLCVKIVTYVKQKTSSKGTAN